VLGAPGPPHGYGAALGVPLKVYPLRIDKRLYDALERWASDDLRSVNAQIEFLLRESLRRADRPPAPSSGEDGPGE
jgi:hypothetical protein